MATRSEMQERRRSRGSVRATSNRAYRRYQEKQMLLEEARRRQLIDEQEAAHKNRWIKGLLGGLMAGVATAASFGAAAPMIAVGGAIGAGAGAVSSMMDDDMGTYNLMAQGAGALGAVGRAQQFGQKGNANPTMDYRMSQLAPGPYANPQFDALGSAGGAGNMGSPFTQRQQKVMPMGAAKPQMATQQMPVATLSEITERQPIAEQAQAARQSDTMTRADLAAIRRSRRGLGLPEYAYAEELMG